MNFRKNGITFNILFWLAYFTYEWLANAALANEWQRYFVNAAVIVPTTALAGFFTVHILLKRYYLRDKKIFWTGFLASLVVFVLARRGFNYYYTYPLYYPEGVTLQSFLFLPKIIIEAVNIYLIVGLYSMFYFIDAWYEELRVAQSLKQEKVEAELQLLKSQVHPHFIFNTLNNIYSYALHGNSKTADLIHRLSSFLSYNLYDSKLSSIALTRELEYIDSYIELEKIRYGSRLDISVNVFNSIEDFNISPLLLLPLVENSFKHGFTSSSVEKGWIRIDLSRQGEWLTVKVENSMGREERQVPHKNGIGLENVKRRLEIIYPDDHEFRCISEKNTFFLILKIRNLREVSVAGIDATADEKLKTLI